MAYDFWQSPYVTFQPPYIPPYIPPNYHLAHMVVVPNHGPFVEMPRLYTKAIRDVTNGDHILDSTRDVLGDDASAYDVHHVPTFQFMNRMSCARQQEEDRRRFDTRFEEMRKEIVQLREEHTQFREEHTQLREELRHIREEHRRFRDDISNILSSHEIASSLLRACDKKVTTLYPPLADILVALHGVPLPPRSFGTFVLYLFVCNCLQRSENKPALTFATLPGHTYLVANKDTLVDRLSTTFSVHYLLSNHDSMVDFYKKVDHVLRTHTYTLPGNSDPILDTAVIMASLKCTRGVIRNPFSHPTPEEDQVLRFISNNIGVGKEVVKEVTRVVLEVWPEFNRERFESIL